MSKGSVLITGASTGIGREIALEMARLGFHVFAGVRKDADGRALQSEAPDLLTPVLIDVTDAPSIARAAAAVREALDGSPLTGLVNNAGITVVGPLEFTELNDLRYQLEVNLIGHIAVTQAFLPLLREGKGRIVNVGSMVGRAAIPFAAPYGISKFGLEAFTESLRMELKPWGIHVSMVGPGAIATPLWGKSVENMDRSFNRLPEAAQGLYARSMAKIREYQVAWATGGIAPEKVVHAVRHALTAGRPSPRYVIGTDAWQAELLRLLPTRIREAMLLWKMGLNDGSRPHGEPAIAKSEGLARL